MRQRSLSFEIGQLWRCELRFQRLEMTHSRRLPAPPRQEVISHSYQEHDHSKIDLLAMIGQRHPENVMFAPAYEWKSVAVTKPLEDLGGMNCYSTTETKENTNGADWALCPAHMLM